jgi:hypothetical protein
LVARRAAADSAVTDTIPAPPPTPPSLAQLSPEGDWVNIHVPPNFTPSGRMQATAVYDPVGDRVIVYGGWTGSSGLGQVLSLQLRPAPSWGPLQATGTLPPALYGHSAIYDPVRARIVYFGGITSGSPTNQVWTLTLGPNPSWSLLTVSGTPPVPRSGQSAVYDASRDRMLVFGGYDGSSYHNDVWELDFSPSPSWSEVQATPAPGVRSGQTAVYDPGMDRMILFGGSNGTNYLADTWALSFDGGPHWVPLAAGPGARTLATSIYDPAAGGMWMFGGLGSAGGYVGALFLSLGAAPAWSFPTHPSAPKARWGSASCLDPVADRMVVFGGNDGSQTLNEVWALPLSAGSSWGIVNPVIPPPPVEPPPRLAASLFLDAGHDRLILFGGSSDRTTGMDSTWALPFANLDEWVELHPGGSPPPPRFSQAQAYDTKRNREIIFGGFGDTYLNDAWALSLTDPESWANLSPVGGLPAPRDATGAIYDADRDRLVVFGGWDGHARRNDVWTLPLAGPSQTWQQQPPGAPIAARSGFACAYDPMRQSMWVVGGEVAENVGVMDVWRLSLDTDPMQWTQLTVSGTPPSQRWGHSIVYESAHDRLLLFGGYGPTTWNDDVWALNLAGTPTWKLLAPSGGPPPARVWAGVVLDPTRDWLIVDGGNASGIFRDTWALEFDQPTPALATWIESEEIPGGIRLQWYAPVGTLAEIERRTENTSWESLGWESADGTNRVIHDDLAVTAGARYEYRLMIAGMPYGDSWVALAAAGLALHGFPSNPAGSRPSIAFRLADAEPARLEVLDLRGRIVYRSDVGSLGAGDHTVKLDGTRLAAGVYFIQLEQGAQMRRVKSVVLP